MPEMQIKSAPVKPLTAAMQEILMECHEREILKLEPLEAGVTRCAGLVARGLLETKFYIMPQGKKIAALYITGMGRLFLENL